MSTVTVATLERIQPEGLARILREQQVPAIGSEESKIAIVDVRDQGASCDY